MSILQFVTTVPSDEPDFILSSRAGAKFACNANDRTPEGRAAALDQMFKEVQATDTLTLGTGTWDYGPRFCTLPFCTVSGRGKGATVLVSNQEDQRHHCGVDQTKGSILTDMSIIWQPKDSLIRGGQAIGYAATAAPPIPVTASMKRVAVYSWGSVAWYLWGAGKFHKFAATDSDFYAGRIAVEIGMASASDCVEVVMNNCKLGVNFGIYGGAGGDIGQRSLGVLVRGGSCTMNGGSIDVVGYGGSGIPGDNNEKPFELACAAATSSLGAPIKPGDPLPEWGNGEWPLLNLNGVASSVTANGARDALDAWGHIGKLNINGGKGSGRNGDWLYRGTQVDLIPPTQGVPI